MIVHIGNPIYVVPGDGCCITSIRNKELYLFTNHFFFLRDRA